MFSSLPYALVWFALTAVIYLFQVIPFTGIFLMILAAPFWSITTINAGFIFLGLEALARPQHRAWLVAPLLYFGGYAYYANLSHQELARLDAEFREFNEGKSAVEASIAQRTDLSLQNLRKIIADPTERLTYHDIKGLNERPDLWRGLIPDMLDALDRAFDGGGRTRERAGMLQDLFNKLTERDYRPISQAILASLSRRPDLSNDYVRSQTLSRLGSLGVPALAVLSHRLFGRSRRPDAGAVLGFCKIGEPAAWLADRIAQPVITSEGHINRDTAFAVYVTLLRFGRADLAGAMRSHRNLSKDKVAARLALEIGPSSPSDVCINRSRWRSRLRKTGI